MAAQTVEIADDTSKDEGWTASVAVARSSLGVNRQLEGSASKEGIMSRISSLVGFAI